MQASVNEKGENEKKIWEKLGLSIERFENVSTYNLNFVLQVMNVKFGDVEIGDAVGKWGVDGVSEDRE